MTHGIGDSPEPVANLAVPVDMVTDEDILPDDAVKKRLGVAFWICGGWLVLIALVAVLAPILPIEDPHATSVGPPRDSPSLDHYIHSAIEE